MSHAPPTSTLRFPGSADVGVPSKRRRALRLMRRRNGPRSLCPLERMLQVLTSTKMEALMGENAGTHFVGIDLHRRRSVIVRPPIPDRCWRQFRSTTTWNR